MKKLMLVAAVAAMAFGAKADYSVRLWPAYFGAANGDASPATENLTENGYYKAFVINYSGEQTIDEYVAGSTMAAIAGQTLINYNYGSEYNEYDPDAGDSGQYCLDNFAAGKYTGLNINPDTAYMIVYYTGGADTPSEYLAIANNSDYASIDELYFDDFYEEYTTGWHDFGSPTPVPEPTSGLLLLIGVAGLALKRKRA